MPLPHAERVLKKGPTPRYTWRKKTQEENTMTTYTLALAITGIISLSSGFMRLLSRLEGER